ncbi:MAG TPA: hypothetical protein VIM73_02875 [Polyangiaceae bacterium]|jgi:hypothetical protein
MTPQVDIRALLLIALDEKPPPNLPDRVMARVAALTTMLEFARLLSAAPLDWLSQRRESSGSDDDGNDPSDS